MTEHTNLDAEGNLIGGLLTGGDINDVTDRVQVADFHNPDLGAAYAAIATLYATNQVITPASVTRYLRSRGKRTNEETLATLSQQAQASLAYLDLETYAEVIRDHAQNRALSATLTRALHRTRDPGLTPSEKIERAQQEVLAINAATTRDIAAGPELAQAAYERIERRQNAKGGLIGISTGYTDLDRSTGGLQGGSTYVIAGRTAMGKSLFAFNLAANIALGQSKPVFIVSLEMGRESVAERIMGMWARVGKADIERGLLPDNRQRLQKAYETMAQGPLYLDDASSSPLARITARARQLHHRSPLGFIVVDYVQLVATERTDGETRTLQVGAVSRGLKALARELNVPVMLLAQVNRGVEQRPNKRPMLSDLRESGDLEQDADCVMFIYRDEYYDPDSPDKGVAEIIIAKQRDGETGTVRLRYDAETGRFDNLEYKYPEVTA